MAERINLIYNKRTDRYTAFNAAENRSQALVHSAGLTLVDLFDILPINCENRGEVVNTMKTLAREYKEENLDVSRDTSSSSALPA